MNVLILNTKEEVAQFVSDAITSQIKKKKSSVLGLASGNTMIPIYKKLTKKRIDFSKVKTFNLDEYYHPKDEKKTMSAYMNKHLFSKTNLKKQNTHLLNYKTQNARKECTSYESKIKKTGGIDLQLLGLGRDGHIAFNEPGSSFNSKTRVVKLHAMTRKDNSAAFDSLKDTPSTALTIGIKTILSAKRIALIATGKHKAQIVKRIIENSPSIKVPASALHKHPETLVILDRAAASRLKREL